VLRIQFALCMIACLSGSAVADIRTPESIDADATHQQVAIIRVSADEVPAMPINAFCLNRKGQIVAACGSGPGEVRIINDDGKVLRSWAVAVKPEAINVANNGTILVGGEGKLMRFDATGKELQQAESPHAAALRASVEKLRKEAVSMLTRSPNSLGSRIALYERVIDQLEEKAQKGTLNEQEERTLKLLPATLERFKQQAAAQPQEQKTDSGPSEDAIQQQVQNMIKSKMRISSISSGGDHVFVATRGTTGYGYEVWRMDNELSGGSVIIKGLSGCCGQMDVQCCRNGLFVAENSRHRVVRYDTNGEQVTTWGKGDRTGINGFSSCCNPMNVCFNGAGEVFTAESGTGRIKRFNADGKFVAYVGDVDLVPGCKNVSIAVSPNTDKVYMLDLTRNHIVVMKTRPKQTGEQTTAGTQETGS
jgi:hypothetical protein